MVRERLNVLWIMTDQHRGQAMGCAGDPNVETPNLDRLAKEGVRFSRAYTNTPLCTPSRACLYTGQYITTHGALSNHYPVLPRQPVLAEIMRDNGYRTSHFGKWHMAGGCFGQHFVSPYFRPGWDDWTGWECQHQDYFCTSYSRGTSPAIRKTNKYQTDWLADQTIEWLKAQRRSRPWFHVVSIEPPHDPYVAPDEYMAAFRESALQFRPNVPLDHPIRDEGSSAIRGYYAQIRNIDDNIGRVIGALEETGQFDQTIIFYFSDHGDMMGSHGRMGKSRPEEESSNIPLIVRHPNHPRGGTADALIGSIDIMPTLQGLLEIPVPPSVEGQDFSDTVRGDNDKGADAVYLQYEGFGFVEQAQEKWRAIRSGPWSYACTQGGQPMQLFDLDSDPYQVTNLVDSPDYQPVRAELQEAIEKKAFEIGDPFFG